MLPFPHLLFPNVKIRIHWIEFNMLRHQWNVLIMAPIDWESLNLKERHKKNNECLKLEIDKARRKMNSVFGVKWIPNHSESLKGNKINYNMLTGSCVKNVRIVRIYRKSVFYHRFQDIGIMKISQFSFRFIKHSHFILFYFKKFTWF